MSEVKIKLNSAGVRQLLKSPKIQAVCQAQAKAIAARCGSGYASDVYIGRNRANAMVWPDTPQAEKDNAENNTILKALK